jgi:hypothetical protein
MMNLSLDPIGMGLLRELVEAYEAVHASSDPDHYTVEVLVSDSYQDELANREDGLDDLTDAFCSHLILMGSPHVDTQVLKDLWAAELLKPSNMRGGGKLPLEIWNVCRKYIELYNAPGDAS